MLDLLHDYQNNVKPVPAGQEDLRTDTPRALLTRGRSDAFFPPGGARAYPEVAGGQVGTENSRCPPMPGELAS